MLENRTVPQKKIAIGYRKISPNLLSTDEVIDLIPSTVNLALPLRSENHITQVDDSLFDQVVESISYSVDPTLVVEIEIHTA